MNGFLKLYFIVSHILVNPHPYCSVMWASIITKLLQYKINNIKSETVSHRPLELEDLLSLGGNCQGSKLSLISWMTLPSWIYNCEYFTISLTVVPNVLLIAYKMSVFLRLFKLLKQSEITPNCWEMASNEIKNYREMTATRMKRGYNDFSHQRTTRWKLPNTLQRMLWHHHCIIIKQMLLVSLIS